jgi:type I restriction enzyme R subunit
MLGNKKQEFYDIEVEDIDARSTRFEKRINKIVDYIIAYHDQNVQ